MGSTSYDEARDPADASWSGASWYGPTTGEYWIINPREYADPRKHGPEYQSRARRMAGGPSVSGTIEDEPPYVSVPGDDDAGEADPAAGWTGGGPAPRDDAERDAFETRSAAADPRRRRTRAERATAAGRAARVAGAARTGGGTADPIARGTASAWDAARIREARRARGRLDDVEDADRRERAAGRERADVLRGERTRLGDSARDLLGGTADDPVRRLGTALVAWPPIGIAAAAAIGDVTGCNAFSAACGDTDAVLPWLAQPGILGLLLLLPALARLLAGGTVAVLMALVPVTAFLLVVGGAGAPEAGFALAFLLGVAWLLGVAGSIVGSRRRIGPVG